MKLEKITHVRLAVPMGELLKVLQEKGWLPDGEIDPFYVQVEQDGVNSITQSLLIKYDKVETVLEEKL